MQEARKLSCELEEADIYMFLLDREVIRLLNFILRFRCIRMHIQIEEGDDSAI